jgi:polygalacturonase
MKRPRSPTISSERAETSWARLASASAPALLIAAVGCSANDDIAAITYVCGNQPPPAPGDPACGAGDTNLPLEPSLPTAVCQTLVANKSTPDESDLDTSRIQAAINACSGGAVKLTGSGENNAFIADHLTLTSATLWIDGGVTLYASRNAQLYQKTGSCGVIGVNDSGACNDFLTVSGTSPGIVGDGIIDGQGGEPLVGHDYSWWQLSNALRDIDGSIGNPTLINVIRPTTGFLLYRITLHNSPKFHVKLASSPAAGAATCMTPGEGFIVWGITILTPSRWTNSQGLALSPLSARNSDGVDPGENDVATCGVIACNTISTGDDHVAIKGGHWVTNVVVAHNHFGTGHGMSIGSETYGDKAPPGHASVENILVYDLTIDADSRPVGAGANPADANGIRVKSDLSRGGSVNNVTFRDVCMRDMANVILMSTAYNPLFSGARPPSFGNITFQDIHHVTCMGKLQPVVTLDGFSAIMPAGPITLDNVVVDNIGPQGVYSAFADIRLGPGDVNFTPSGRDVTVTNGITGGSTPRACTFPTLPTPAIPADWLR